VSVIPGRVLVLAVVVQLSPAPRSDWKTLTMASGPVPTGAMLHPPPTAFLLAGQVAVAVIGWESPAEVAVAVATLILPSFFAGLAASAGETEIASAATIVSATATRLRRGLISRRTLLPC
jgi:hypothetical protein